MAETEDPALLVVNRRWIDRLLLAFVITGVSVLGGMWRTQALTRQEIGTIKDFISRNTTELIEAKADIATLDKLMERVNANYVFHRQELTELKQRIKRIEDAQ